jgi:hypothetical protein
LAFGLGKNKTDLERDTCFYWDQCDYKVFLLHGDDEKWRPHKNRGQRRLLHMSMMHPTNKDGAVMALMFRKVQNFEMVHMRTSKLVNPPDRPDIGEFDAIRDSWQNNPTVIADQVAVTSKVKAYLEDHHI